MVVPCFSEHILFGTIPQVSALKYSNDSALYAACLDVPVSDFQQARDQECLDLLGVPVSLGVMGVSSRHGNGSKVSNVLDASACT